MPQFDKFWIRQCMKYKKKTSKMTIQSNKHTAKKTLQKKRI